MKFSSNNYERHLIQTWNFFLSRHITKISPLFYHFQIFSDNRNDVKREYSQTRVNIVRLYICKKNQTWSTLSSHNWLELSTFIWHFSVLVFYDSSFLLCRPLKRYSPSPKTLRSTNSTFTYQSFSLQDSRAIQHCTNIITEGAHRHLTVFRKNDTL